MDDTERVDVERKHLEGLLKDRISFFLLFAPVLVAASYNINNNLGIRAGVLGIGTLISLLLSLAIYRTHRFVELALKDILQDAQHPYTRYRAAIRFPPNANKLLIPIPFVLTAMFGWLTIVAFCASRAS
jgi:hypothetical protein